MPKMDRTTFIAVIDDMWILAEETLAKRGVVWSTLIALNAKGQRHIFMELDPKTPGLEKSDVTLLGGPFRENVGAITEAFRAHGAVAAILYAEAWTVSDETYAETVRMDISAHEHPLKNEALFSVGFWPREFVARGHQATIDRDDAGAIAGLSDYRKIEDSSATFLVSWLAEALPQPH